MSNKSQIHFRTQCFVHNCVKIFMFTFGQIAQKSGSTTRFLIDWRTHIYIINMS